ncbi:cell division protein FtsQ/DivIB [Ostreiculturibacter nitratireducens]|uniref:cell division protein FtsQ/DivIB n=1 Tax=Ostreiculturibacter nitratireducens TaxID=3075226 RepID=UPI0031B65054
MQPLIAERRYPPSAPEPREKRAPVFPRRVRPQKHDADGPRDPAPSRIAYRMQRLWLTPVFRTALRVGLPAFVVTLSVGIWFSDEVRRDAFVDRFAEMKREVQERPEFMVTMMAVDGAAPEVAEAIRAMMPVNLPVSSFDLDLEALRQVVSDIDAVARAQVRVRPGGILQVDVTERVPAAIWRTQGRLDLVDGTGHRVATLLDREARADLPLLAGAGADKAVPEALALLAAAKPVIGRVRGLVRVGERRWDLVLNRDQRILLPEEGAVRALERVIALDQAEEMLARDITVVDMRNEHRPTIRLAEGALKGNEQGGNETEVAAE